MNKQPIQPGYGPCTCGGNYFMVGVKFTPRDEIQLIDLVIRWQCENCLNVLPRENVKRVGN